MANELTPIGPGEWNANKAAHLLSRAGFGGTPEDVARVKASYTGHYLAPMLAKR